MAQEEQQTQESLLGEVAPPLGLENQHKPRPRVGRKGRCGVQEGSVAGSLWNPCSVEKHQALV